MYGWKSVPRELAMTEEEAKATYKDSPAGCGIYTVISFTDGVFPLVDENKHYYIMKGAKRCVMAKHAWYNSHSNGGYVEAVVERYLLKKFGGRKPWSDRGEYYDDIRDTVYKMAEKHYLHHRTSDTIIKNLMSKSWDDEGLFY